MTIDQLNNDYAIAGQLEFVAGKGGFPLAKIDNGRARALVSVYAGQVLSFQPASQSHDVLFVSDAAYYRRARLSRGASRSAGPGSARIPRAGVGQAMVSFATVSGRCWTRRWGAVIRSSWSMAPAT